MIAAALVLVVLVAGTVKRVDAYAAFVEGTKEGLRTAVSVVPHLCAALLVIAALRGSGVLEWLERLLEPVCAAVGVPGELLPFLVMRPVSGSGALSALQELMRTEGADSRAAFAAAAMMGSSETVLYVLSVYLGSVGMKKARYCVWVGMVSMGVGMAVCLWLTAGA